MKKELVKEIVHEQLESKFEEYPKLLEHCKGEFDSLMEGIGTNIENPRVRVIMPVVGWIDSGLPMSKVVDFEVHGGIFIFKIHNAPYTEEQARHIRA